MTKRTRNGRKRSCKTSCLACTFFSICKLLLDKKRKKKKKKNCCDSQKFFPLQMKCFFLFLRKFFTRNSSQKLIFPKVCQKFCDFLNSRKFLPLKYICNSKYLKAKRKLIITGMIDLCQNQFAIFPILQDLIFCLWKPDSG